jgi:transposase
MHVAAQEEKTMHDITIGLDIAKSVFQAHVVDGDGKVLARKRLRRAEVLAFFAEQPPALVGIEACSTAHHWARELGRLGHEVRLMPASYVKPYVKRGKSDAVDAEAIAEAVSRPTMRFVPVKSGEQQAVLMLHRSRDLLVRQRTMLANALRGHLAEFGVVAPAGLHRVTELVEAAGDACRSVLPDVAKGCVATLAASLEEVETSIAAVERQILKWHRSSEVSRRLESIPGVGVITASALAATVTDAGAFSSGRQLAAWLGLTPRQSGTGGKMHLGKISKQGDRYIRRLLVLGATALVRYARKKPTALSRWINGLLDRRPTRLVTVAIANKLARIAWAVMARGERFRNEGTIALAVA